MQPKQLHGTMGEWQRLLVEIPYLTVNLLESEVELVDNLCKRSKLGMMPAERLVYTAYASLNKKESYGETFRKALAGRLSKEQEEQGAQIEQMLEQATERNAELEKENAALKEERRWRKFSEEKPAHHQWIFVINPRRPKYASPIETRRWDDGMKFDVEAQELYKVWMPQMETPEVE